MRFSTFEQIVKYMERFTNLERKPDLYSSKTYGLERIREILEIIGNPQNSYKTIHIAGSKGKGSTASFIAKGLNAAGFRTGLYMSPHVSDYRERFTLAGKFADEQVLVATGNMLAQMLENYTKEPTTFEMYTAFAFLLFKNLKCEWAVIETGLGGRLDATNTLLPQACVFTPIELEHTDLLGNTIHDIAVEKSKIITKGTQVFISRQPEEAMQVLKAESESNKCKVSSLDENISEITTYVSNLHQHVEISYKDGYSTKLDLEMLGEVQAYNCALAILVLRTLGLYRNKKTDYELEKVTLEGRMEKAFFERKLFIDGAHTANSIANLVKTFRQIYPGKNGICIFGSVLGKKYEQMLHTILDNFDNVVICRPGNFKPSDPKGLYITAKSAAPDKNIVLKEEADDALQYCLDNSTQDTPVLVCGSFYLAGVIKEALKCRCKAEE